jgi:hypothetical protein
MPGYGNLHQRRVIRDGVTEASTTSPLDIIATH